MTFMKLFIGGRINRICRKDFYSLSSLFIEKNPGLSSFFMGRVFEDAFFELPKYRDYFPFLIILVYIIISV